MYGLLVKNKQDKHKNVIYIPKVRRYIRSFTSIYAQVLYLLLKEICRMNAKLYHLETSEPFLYKNGTHIAFSLSWKKINECEPPIRGFSISRAMLNTEELNVV